MQHRSENATFTPDDAMQAKVLAEQVRMFVANTPSVCFFASIFAIMLAVYVSAHTPNTTLVGSWISLKLLIVIPRVWQAYKLQRSDALLSKKATDAALLFVLLDGIVWGLAGPMLLPSLGEQASTIVGCSLVAVVALAAFTLHIFLKAMLAYCLPILAIPALTYFTLGNIFGIFGGLALLVFLLGIIPVGKRANANVTEMIWRRFTMDMILQDKEKALLEAARQDATKNQFVATMSHELRTPLHGIIGLTRLLSKELKNTNHMQRVVAIEKSGNHLLSLINSVLDFSRIEASHVQLESKNFNLSELIEDITDITKATATEKGIEYSLKSKVSPNLSVKGDPQKIKQVILNLVGNSIKFTEKGHLKILVTYMPREHLLTVEVSDSGIGISTKDLSSIFEPYKQAKTASGRIHGGTGLGLTIAREISRAMGGDINCKSEVGIGSTFTYTAILPITTQEKNEEINPTTLPAKINTQSISHNKLILLAEDNDVNALIAIAIISSNGFSYEHVTDGQAAIERANNTTLDRPDLILMDCQMPKVDGFEATAKIRAIEKERGLKRIPIIALTASAMAEDNKKCFASGMDAHLSKPFTETQLIRVISTLA